MYSIVTLPSASTILASSTEYASPIFTDFSIFAFMVIGVGVAVYAVKLVQRTLLKGGRRVTGHK